jgi:hypothetical protein
MVGIREAGSMYLKLIFVEATMLATSAIAQKAIDGSDSALDPEIVRTMMS